MPHQSQRFKSSFVGGKTEAKLSRGSEVHPETSLMVDTRDTKPSTTAGDTKPAETAVTKPVEDGNDANNLVWMSNPGDGKVNLPLWK